MENWDDLKYVFALKKYGSLVKAANFLKTNPTTVSRHIQRISTTYKETLFVRKSNGEWELTSSGVKFARAAESCEVAIKDLLSGTPNDRPKVVTISTTGFVAEAVLAPRIDQFMPERKDIQLVLNSEDRNVSLAFGEADLAIRLGRPNSGKMIVSKLSNLRMGLFAASEEQTDWIGLPTSFDWVPEMKLAYNYFGCEPKFRSNSFLAIEKIASENGLACVGPEFVFEGSNSLRRIEESPFAFREVWTVFHETRRNDLDLSQVRMWVKKCFKELKLIDG